MGPSTNQMRLIYRQKLLLGLTQVLGNRVPATDFQKLLFLFTRSFDSRRAYEFVPYKFGCYSFQAAADQHKLIASGYLADESAWILQRPSLNYLSAITPEDQERLKNFARQHAGLKGKKLIQHVYENFPYFAINSEIAHKYMSCEQQERIRSARPPKRRKKAFFSIGYEGSHVEDYLNLLINNDVRLLIDVRKNPLSRKYGFSKRSLSTLLEKFGIKYVHLRSLGVDSSDRQQLETQEDYERLFKAYDASVLAKNGDAIDEILRLYSEYKRVAVTCFERDHFQCHRSRVVDAVNRRSDVGEVMKLVA